jgi:hypothetical protein
LLEHVEVEYQDTESGSDSEDDWDEVFGEESEDEDPEEDLV